MTRVDLNRAITSTVAVARSEWRLVAELELDLDSELEFVCCDVGEINQVILNIVVNAAHAIGDQLAEGELGRIEVATRQDDREVEIRVSDTGGGIPAEIQNQVFDPFFTTKEVGRGTGQGLALAHRVVTQEHQGELRFEVQPGVGTTFVIRLPIAGPAVEVVSA